METLAADQNISDPKVKNQIAAQVIPLIEDLPNPLERDTYRQALARMLRVDERALLGTQAQGPRMKRPRGGAQRQVVEKSDAGVAIVSSSKKTEEYLIGVLFRKPELLYRLDRVLQEFGLNALDAQDFEYTDHKLLFGLIRESVEQYKTEHHDFVVEAMPASLQVRSEELVKGAEKLDRMEEKQLEELLRGVIKLRRVAAGENLNQLRFLQEEAHQGGDMRASSYTELVLQNKRLLRYLDQAFKQMSAKRLE
jgi:DNA primase